MHATQMIKQLKSVGRGIYGAFDASAFEDGPSRAGRNRGKSRRSRRGFSLTELLVVIAIIVILVGLLLVALRQVQIKSRRTKTESTMNQFANACVAFQAEHGFYPGVIPDSVLKVHENAPNALSISSTENALLALMGGCRVLTPMDVDPASPTVLDYNAYSSAGGPNVHEYTFNGPNATVWKLKVDRKRLGEGPTVNGKPYAPYFTPGPSDLIAVEGQIGEDPTFPLPDLVDAWGDPILLLKQSRDGGPLAEDPNSAGSLPQFERAGIRCFTNSTKLGELGKDQSKTNVRGSCFERTGTTTLQKSTFFGCLLGHANFYRAPAGGGQPSAPLYGRARGSIMLQSAGPDGIYFSAVDGPGTEAAPLDAGKIDTLIIPVGPKILDDFDDIRVYAGG